MTTCHSPAQPTWHSQAQMNELLLVGPPERSLPSHLGRDNIIEIEEHHYEPI